MFSVSVWYCNSVYCFGFSRKAVFSEGWASLCVAQGRSDTLTHCRTDVHSSHSRKSSPSAEMNERVLIERCVSSVRACTCSARHMTRCESQTGTHCGWRVFLWIFNGRCWSSHVWNKNNSSSKTCRMSFCWYRIFSLSISWINPLPDHPFYFFRTELNAKQLLK